MKSLEEMGKYATVVIDPPWPQKPAGWTLKAETLASIQPYKLMPVGEISDIPVADVLAEDAFLFCWTINRFLADAFTLLSAWDVHYMFTMTWVKNDAIQLPLGPRYNSEWILVGRKGHPQFKETTGFRLANCWPQGAHSEKPEGFYDLLRRVTPGPRLDIFGRRQIAGFDSWGDEAPEGPALPSYYQGVFA